jgi:8-oxo-dGTP pyrophosphatase MutT (NUDIX family)
MPYQPVLSQLRRLASMPVFRPVAGLVIVDASERVAMAYQEYANQGWCFPKGGVDHTETNADAAVREAREEIGLEVELVGIEPLSFTGKDFRESLGFGSPRGARSMIYKPQCLYFGNPVEVTKSEPPGASISRGAYELLAEAWRSHHGAEADEADILGLYDQAQGENVIWRQSPTYFLAAFKSHCPEEMTGETDETAWFTLTELKERAKRAEPFLPNKLHGDVARIALHPDISQWIGMAASRAMPNNHLTR